MPETKRFPAPSPEEGQGGGIHAMRLRDQSTGGSVPVRAASPYHRALDFGVRLSVA